MLYETRRREKKKKLQRGKTSNDVAVIEDENYTIGILKWGK